MFGTNDYKEDLNKEIERLEGLYEKHKTKGWKKDRLQNWYDKFLGKGLIEQKNLRKEAKEEQEKILKEKQKIDAAATTTYGGPDTSDWNPSLARIPPTHIGAGPLHGVGGNQGGYNHPGSAESRRSSDPFNEGGLATMFTRRR